MILPQGDFPEASHHEKIVLSHAYEIARRLLAHVELLAAADERETLGDQIARSRTQLDLASSQAGPDARKARTVSPYASLTSPACCRSPLLLLHPLAPSFHSTPHLSAQLSPRPHWQLGILLAHTAKFKNARCFFFPDCPFKDACRFMHGAEDRRRNPLLYNYRPAPCTQDGACRKANACEFAHGALEGRNHPLTMLRALHTEALPPVARLVGIKRVDEEGRVIEVAGTGNRAQQLLVRLTSPPASWRCVESECDECDERSEEGKDAEEEKQEEGAGEDAEELIDSVASHVCEIVGKGRVCLSVSACGADSRRHLPHVTLFSPRWWQDLPKEWLDLTDSARAMPLIRQRTQAFGFRKTSELLKHQRIAACVRTYVDSDNNQMRMHSHTAFLAVCSPQYMERHLDKARQCPTCQASDTTRLRSLLLAASSGVSRGRVSPLPTCHHRERARREAADLFSVRQACSRLWNKELIDRPAARSLSFADSLIDTITLLPPAPWGERVEHAFPAPWEPYEGLQQTRRPHPCAVSESTAASAYMLTAAPAFSLFSKEYF
ncbi:hypothetical protein AB1Y20_009063 [Prymnesium parvum]|uniref:C3H1-type domain-containing protein n=1 Tax=Prymnesium parvum TaxID=97485 RepID=A0AB34K2S4_PRYPA